MTADGYPLTVLYDADCDVCRHTAHVLRTLDGRRRLRLRPLQGFAAEDSDAPAPSALLARLHARDRDGAWFAGGRAVTRIAAEIPLLAPLGAVGRIPAVEPVLESAYRLVADHRSAIGRWLRLDGCRFEPDPPC
jgi:predicted DCC family thiol-disulfide oxidoreductase YuxK